MVLLGGAEIWTTCWTDPTPVTFHWQESPFTTNKRSKTKLQQEAKEKEENQNVKENHPLYKSVGKPFKAGGSAAPPM